MFSVATSRVSLELATARVIDGRTSFDITRSIDYACSGTSSAYIDSNIVIHVRIQVVVRTALGQHGDCEEPTWTYSMLACLEGLRKF